MWTQRGYLINNPRLVKDMLTNEHTDYQKAISQMEHCGVSWLMVY